MDPTAGRPCGHQSHGSELRSPEEMEPSTARPHAPHTGQHWAEGCGTVPPGPVLCSVLQLQRGFCLALHGGMAGAVRWAQPQRGMLVVAHRDRKA